MNPSAQSQLSTPSAGDGAPEEVELDFMQVVVRIVRGYKWVLGGALIGCALSIALSLAIHKSYTTEAMFLPPVNPDAIQATSLLLRQDPSDLYMGMLASRSVADSVIDQAHLMDVYQVRFRADARVMLARQRTFVVQKNALISISVTTHDPQLSAAIANAYLEALYKVNGEMNASASSHRSEFYEAQLDAEKNSLADAESQMKQMEEKSGTVLPEREAQAGVTATADLQAAIQEDEAQLSSLLTGSTEQNPAVVRLRAQISALRGELRQHQPGNGLPSTANMPGLMLDYLRKSRDLKERETLYEALTAQYEKARLASLDPGPQLEIVDRAQVPERKSGPPRTLIVVVGTMLGALLGLALVLSRRPWQILRSKYRLALAQPDRR
jgi:tyrosine-protein kinase Etk/Wzc